MRAKTPFQKNRDFAVGVILTVAEGILSGCSYLSIYLVLKMLLEGNADRQGITRVTALLLGIFALRLVIYGAGYTKVQVGGAAVSKNLRLFLGDKFKKIPLSRFTRGQVGSM